MGMHRVNAPQHVVVGVIVGFNIDYLAMITHIERYKVQPFFGRMSDRQRYQMAKPRPLSPHLQIYRLPLPAVMSIMHRISGAALASGTVLIVLWLVMLAAGADWFALAAGALAHPLGKLVLFGYSLALVYHGLNGVRHMVWDLCIGLEVDQVYRSGYLVLAMTVVVTACLWLVI
jgi:succinate dehydrogenase / fumarate reductase cytochrome b subunit